MSNQNMRTPLWLFDLCQRIAGTRFVLDAAASDRDAMLPKYYTRVQCGLSQPWEDATFCNPPFKYFGRWIAKARKEAQRGVNSILIGPKGCSQTWFHTHAIRGTIYCPDKRISFLMPDGTPTTQAREDAMIYAMGPRHTSTRWLPRLGRFDVRALKIER